MKTRHLVSKRCLSEGSLLEPNDKTISAMNEIKNKRHELDVVKGVDELDKYLSKLK